jgi:hypothetical protein
MKALYKGVLYTVDETVGSQVGLLDAKGDTFWIELDDFEVIVDPTDAQIREYQSSFLDRFAAKTPRKPFADLTDAEVIDLSPEDVQFYTDRLAAERSIPLLQEAPEDPKITQPQKDAVAFRITVSLQKRTDAEAVARFAEQFLRWDIGYKSIPGLGYESTASPEFDPIHISEERYYTEAYGATIGAQMERFTEAKKSYEAAMKAYRETVEQHVSIQREIAARRSEALQRRRLVEQCEKLFERYMELAEGQRRIACKFLSDARPNAAEIIPHRFEPDEQGPMPGAQRKIELGDF